MTSRLNAVVLTFAEHRHPNISTSAGYLWLFKEDNPLSHMTAEEISAEIDRITKIIREHDEKANTEATI